MTRSSNGAHGALMALALMACGGSRGADGTAQVDGDALRTDASTDSKAIDSSIDVAADVDTVDTSTLDTSTADTSADIACPPTAAPDPNANCSFVETSTIECSLVCEGVREVYFCRGTTPSEPGCIAEHTTDFFCCPKKVCMRQSPLDVACGKQDAARTNGYGCPADPAGTPTVVPDASHNCVPLKTGTKAQFCCLK